MFSLLSLFSIVAANVVSRVLAVLLGSWLSFRVFARCSGIIASLAAGLMLALACTHLIPEAMHVGVDVHEGGLVLLGAFVFFVALECILTRVAGHDHGLPAMTTTAVLLGGRGVPEPTNRVTGRAVTLLLGAACHNFVDGVLIAAAFMVSSLTGLVVTLAVFGHELPQMVGQLVILQQTGLSRARAVRLALLAASASVAGGVAGWAVLSGAELLVGYAMLISAASFIFVVLNVLLPSLTHSACCGDEDCAKLPVKELAAMAAGVVLSLAVLGPLHDEVHEALEAESAVHAGHAHTHTEEAPHAEQDQHADHDH